MLNLGFVKVTRGYVELKNAKFLDPAFCLSLKLFNQPSSSQAVFPQSSHTEDSAQTPPIELPSQLTRTEIKLFIIYDFIRFCKNFTKYM